MESIISVLVSMTEVAIFAAAAVALILIVAAAA